MRRLEAGTHFVRYAIGDLTLVALRDGHVDMPITRLRRDGDRPFEPGLEPGPSLVEGWLRLSVNAFLVVGRDRPILIDTGAGTAWEPTMGSLRSALAEAGFAAEDIETVALTHTHLDHVGGLVTGDGSGAFPRLARLFVPEQEVGRVVDDARLSGLGPRVVPFGDGARLSDRVSARHAPGHEVGHTAFEVACADETLLVWGDVIHVPSVQFAAPDLTWEFDADQARARATRRTLLDRAVRPGVSVAGAHLDFPGVGRVREFGGAYAFEAA